MTMTSTHIQQAIFRLQSTRPRRGPGIFYLRGSREYMAWVSEVRRSAKQYSAQHHDFNVPEFYRMCGIPSSKFVTLKERTPHGDADA